LRWHIDFEPIGRRGPCIAGTTLLEAARDLGIDLIGLCGGQGSCGRCKVQLIAGELSPITGVEQELLSPLELHQGYRLACQAYPQSDIALHVPSESLSAPQRTQVEGRGVPVAPQSMIQAYDVQVAPPSLGDAAADAERVRSALEQQHGVCCESIDLGALRNLSMPMRASGWQAQVVLRESECLAVRAPGTALLGLAVDLGTTKVAAYLIDLQTGHTLASKGLMNPQIAYGEDVVTRITRALQSPQEAARMQALALQALTQLSADLCNTVGADTQDIVDAVVVGNTAMHHLLLRLPVEQLVMAPYVPAVSSALDVKVRDLGLSFAPGAYVHFLPNIAGYVGADHVAMILATQLWEAEGTVLALDIGTNTEICLAHHGQLSSVSCASGPAFEGAHIKHGMRAAAGAIERLRLVDGRAEYRTVGGVPPVGLCGSGILDALAQLFLMGVVDRSGRMHDDSSVRGQASGREYVLVQEANRGGRPAITITQHDVRQLQLAKGAIRTGISALLHAAGIGSDEIQQVIIAGAFGSYIDVSSAIPIGMLPALPLERFRQVGNAAGTGARLALISRQQRVAAAEVAQRVHYIELAGVPNFSDLFAQSMYLGEYRVSST
jgi:uncharacterized 2Fe-2S/4Fe-4S cluster protein (DUF4445 family)